MMTRRQATAVLARPAVAQVIFLIHAGCCVKGADITRCWICADLDDRARVESYQREAARQTVAAQAGRQAVTA